jgi:hypothetical protein
VNTLVSGRAIASRGAGLCALSVIACALGCSCQRERSDPPVIVIPDEPTRPIARPPLQESSLTGEPAPAPVLEHVSGDGYEGWIRPAQSTTSGTAWQPTAELVAVAEAALRQTAPEAVARGDWPKDTDLTSYARQYRGYRTDGVDVLRIDLYCAEARHLASRIVTVSRGGHCFLHTAYDLSTGRFRYFERNPA